MKAKAIIRIIACSVVFCLLLGILCGGLVLERIFNSSPSGETTVLERKVEIGHYRNIEIDWAAGSVLITTGYTNDCIVIKETKDTNNHCTMSTQFDDDTLKIEYGNVGMNFANYSAKDLVIMVPTHWRCENLEINGAALKIDIENLYVESLELAGAAHELNFSGKVQELEAEGTGLKLNLTPLKAPSNISVEGMGCKLDLTMPGDLGFDVTLEGMGVSFSSHVAYSQNGNRYRYGSEDCKIEVSGLGCKVSVDPS